MEQAKTDESLLGKRLYLARKQKSLTLRDLSSKTGLSHTQIHRIEKGATQTKTSAMKQLLEVLDVAFNRDPFHEEAFYKNFHELFYQVLYVNYESAKEIFNSLYQKRDIYENSRCFMDYHLIMLMVVVHTGYRKDLMEHFYQACEAMKDFYEPSKREWFEVMKTIYLKRQFKQKEALEHTERLLEIVRDDHFRGILNYSRGTILIMDYLHYFDAIEALEKAQKLFEDNLNFNRSNRAKAVKQRVYIYLFRFDEFRESFKESESYAKKNGVLDLYYFIHINKALYHIFDEDYEAALKILDTFEFPSPFYYMSKVFSCYKLKHDTEAKKTIEKFKSSGAPFVTTLEERFYKLMIHGLENGEDEVYLDMLKDFTDDALSERNFPKFKQGVSLLTKLLEKRRLYKEAYHYSNTLLSILETIQ